MSHIVSDTVTAPRHVARDVPRQCHGAAGAVNLRCDRPSIQFAPPRAEGPAAQERRQPVARPQLMNLHRRGADRLGDGPDAADDVLDVIGRGHGGCPAGWGILVLGRHRECIVEPEPADVAPPQRLEHLERTAPR